MRHVLEEGFWAGMTLYPDHQMHAAAGLRHHRDVRPRAADGELAPATGARSKPTAVPDFILEMRRRRHPESLIRQIVYENPLTFFRQSQNFQFTPRDAAGIRFV